MAPRVELSTVMANLTSGLEAFSRLPVPTTMTEEYAAAMRLAWRRFRRKGIGHMLTDADRPTFFEHLGRAGLLRLRLLTLTRGHQGERRVGEYCRLSDLGPFFDALAGGEVGCAVEIARMSSAPFNRMFEYEEDYCYAECLFALLRNADASTIETLVEKLDRLTEGDEPPRYSACAALATKNDAGLEAALGAFVQEHEAFYAEMRKDGVMDVEGFATEQYIMIEGLALKALAVERGMSPRSEHKYMPSDAYIHAQAW